MVQVHHDEGVVNRIDPESCAETREGNWRSVDLLLNFHPAAIRVSAGIYAVWRGWEQHAIGGAGRGLRSRSHVAGEVGRRRLPE